MIDQNAYAAALNPDAKPAPAGAAPGVDQSAYEATVQQDVEQRRRNTLDLKRDAELLQYVTEAQQHLPPQQAEEVVSLSAQLNVPPETVQENMDLARQTARSKSIDYESIVRDHPVMAKWMRDPHRTGTVLANTLALQHLDAAVQGRSDIYPAKPYSPEERISRMEAGLPDEEFAPRTVSRAEEMLKKAFGSDLELMKEQAADFFGMGEYVVETTGVRKLTEDQQRERKARMNLLKANGDVDFAGDMGPGSLGAAKKWAYDALTFPIRNAPMMIGGAIAAPLGAALAPTLGISAGLSAFGAMTTFNAAYLLPGTYDKLVEMEGPSGEKVDGATARLFAIPSATLQGAFMSMSFGPMLSKIFNKVPLSVAEAGAGVLKDYTFGRMIADSALTYGKHVGQGVAGMVMQAGVDAVTEQALGAYALNKPFQPEVIRAAMTYAAGRALYDMSGLALWGGGRQYLANRALFERARESFQRNEIMAKGFEAANADMSPERRAEFIKESATQPGAAKHLFLDRELLEAQAKALGVDLEKVLASVGVDVAEVKASDAVDVAVPIEHAGKLLTDKAWADFAKAEGRYHPNDVSMGTLLRDLAAVNEAIDADLSRPVKEWDPEHQEIYNTAREQALKGLGEGYAKDGNDPEFAADSWARHVLKASIQAAKHGETTPKAMYLRLFGGSTVKHTGEANPEYVGTYNPEVRLTRIFLGADEFTLPHEFMHNFLFRLGEEAAHDPKLEGLHNTWAKAMGYANGVDRVALLNKRAAGTLTPEEKAQVDRNEEKLTYMLEVYLAEGVSPSADMADLFTRFRGLAHEWEARTNARFTEARIAQWERMYPELVAPANIFPVSTEMGSRKTIWNPASGHASVVQDGKNFDVYAGKYWKGTFTSEKKAIEAAKHLNTMPVEQARDTTLGSAPRDESGAGRTPEDPFSSVTPEARERFDALFMSITEVERAQKLAGLTQRIDKVYERMTPEERATYSDLLASSTMSAHEILTQWITENSRSKNKEFFRKERERFAEESRNELDRNPVYRLLHFWRTGEMREGPQATTHTAEGTVRADPAVFDAATLKDLLTDADGKPFKISAQSIRDYFGDQPGAEALIKSLNETLQKNIVVKSEERGQPIQLFAELLGVPMDKFMALLDQARPLDEQVARMVEMKMQQKYGVMLMRDQELVQSVAMNAVHDPKVAAKLLMEIRALRKDLDPARAMKLDTLTDEGMREYARKSFQEGMYRDVDPDKYVRMERQAFESAAKHLEAGNIGKAYDYLEKRLLYFHMYREAEAAKRDLDRRIERVFEKATDSKWLGELGKVQQAYRDVTMELLKNLGFMNRKEGEQPLPPDEVIANLKTALVESMQTDAGNALNLDVVEKILADPETYTGAGWKTLPIREVRGLLNVIEGLHNLASSELYATYLDNRIEIAKAHEEIAQHLAIFKDKHKPGADRTQDPVTEKLFHGLRAINANLTDPYGMLMRLGPVGERIYKDYLRSAHEKDALTREVRKFVEEALAAWDTKGDRLTPIPELDTALPMKEHQGPRSKMWLMTTMLWYGSDTGRAKLQRHFADWPDGKIEEMAAKYLTEKDLAWIDSLHRLAEEKLWKRENDLHIYRTGNPLTKVEPMGYTINGKTYKGGYFPVRYDVDLSKASAQRRAESVEHAMGKRGTNAQKTWEYERDPSYIDMPDLNWDRYPAHIMEVVNDVTMGRFVHETAKILLDKKNIAYTLVMNNLGVEMAQQIEPWLKTVAALNEGSVPQHLRVIEQGLNAQRNHLVVAALGLNLPVAFGNMTHAIGANLMAEGLNPRYLMSGLAKTLTPGGRAFIAANSKEVARRMENNQVELVDALRALSHGEVRNARDRMQKLAFIFLETADKIQSRWVWQTEYDRALAHGADHAAAVEAAEVAVGRHMPSREQAEKPAFYRDSKFVGSMTIFQGFISKVYGVMQTTGHQMITRPVAEHGALDPVVMKNAIVYVTRAMAAHAVWSFLGNTLLGHGKGKDETWEQWTAREALAAPMLPFPVVKDLAKVTADKLVTGKTHPSNFLQSPLYAGFYQAQSLLGKIGHKSTPADKVAALSEMALFLAGLPAIQPVRTGKAAYAELTGKAPKEPGQRAFNLVYGKRRNK